MSGGSFLSPSHWSRRLNIRSTVAPRGSCAVGPERAGKLGRVATTREVGTVELGLVVVAPDGRRSDMWLEATPRAPAHALVSALAAALDLDPVSTVTRADGKQVPEEAPLCELGLRHGDELHF